MSFTLKQFEIGPMQNFGYLIGDDHTKAALLVDPAWEADTLFKTVQDAGFELKGFIVTHAHYDHTNALEEMLKKVDIPVYAHAEEIDHARSGSSIVKELGTTAKPMSGGDKLKLGETEITFLHTPGHTPGSQCIRVGNNLITGDTLFIGGCGRTDLPGGDPRALFKTLQKIGHLPGELQIWPGHDYGIFKERALREEKEDNPYFKMTDVNQFLSAVS